MKGKRLRRLSGTVLIMVLTVMLVLIIMLMATLTVVTTASQRIYTKYEENQAYYSARSALDVFTQNMLYDKSYYAYEDSGNKKTFTHGSGVSDPMKQGLAMQLDLYKIKTKDTDDANVPKSLENLLQSEFTDYINSGVTGKDEYKNDFGVVKNVAGEYESVITYEVEYPKVSGKETAGTSHDYGGLADDRKAKITIEVLSREYDMGDDVLTSDSTTKVKDKIASFNGDKTQIESFLNVPQNYDDTVKAVVNGSRKKDKIKLKITATTKVMGVEGTAVLICNSNEPPINNSSRAITAFGGTGSDNMSILGGMSAENTINWGSNTGYIYGPVYVEEDFLMTSNGPKIHLNTGENLVVVGDLQIENNSFVVTNETPSVIIDDENAPFVFIGGELRTGGGLGTVRLEDGSEVDGPFQNIDVVAETINIGDSEVTFDSSCTMYCKGLTINASNSSYNGDIYVDGDVILGSAPDASRTGIHNTGGDTPTTTAYHKGIGSIYYTGVVKDMSGNEPDGVGVGFVQISDSFWDNIPSISDITNPLPTTTEGNDGTKIEFQLPGRTAKKQLETHVQNFDEYYVKDEDGKYETQDVVITKPDGSTETQPRPVVKSAQIMADIDTMIDKSKPFTSADTGITELLSSKVGPGVSHAGVTFSHVLDTGGGEVKCQWDFDNKSIYIKGGGTVTLLLSKAAWGGGIGYSNDNLILVDDDTTLKIVGDTTSGDIFFAKLEIYNQTTWGAYKSQDAGKGVDKLKVGNINGAGIKVPKIYYYFSGSNSFKVQNNCLLTGYIYGPDTEIDFSAASTGVPAEGIEYNGASPTGSTPVCIIGSALVKGASLPNNTGVAYINPDLDDDGDPGDPIHQWQANLYTRN